MILKAKNSMVYQCCEDEVSGSGSTRPAKTKLRRRKPNVLVALQEISETC